MSMLNEFDSVSESTISTKELDALVLDYKEARAIYDEKKAAASEANKEVEKLERQLLEALIQTGKSKYFVDGIGTVSLVEKVYITTPKDGHEKTAFFTYIEEEFGQDGLDKYRTVNSQSLNSLFKIQREENPELITLPGCGDMAISTDLRFTKSK